MYAAALLGVGTGVIDVAAEERQRPPLRITVALATRGMGLTRAPSTDAVLHNSLRGRLIAHVCHEELLVGCVGRLLSLFGV